MRKQPDLIKEFLFTFWNDKNSSNKSDLYQLFSSSLVINSPLGKKVGKNSLAAINNEWLTAFPDMHISNVEIEPYNSAVIANWDCTATQLNAFKGISPTNKEVRYHGETIFFFNENDAVVRYACKVDMVSFYHQLGFRLAPEEYDRQEVIFQNKKLLVKTIKEALPGNLTSREIESVSLNLYGFNSVQMGKILSISPRTVETHLFRAFHGLDCNSKHQCLEKMIDMDLLPLIQDLAKLLMRCYGKTK